MVLAGLVLIGMPSPGWAIKPIVVIQDAVLTVSWPQSGPGNYSQIL